MTVQILQILTLPRFFVNFLHSYKTSKHVVFKTVQIFFFRWMIPNSLWRFFVVQRFMKVCNKSSAVTQEKCFPSAAEANRSKAKAPNDFEKSLRSKVFSVPKRGCWPALYTSEICATSSPVTTKSSKAFAPQSYADKRALAWPLWPWCQMAISLPATVSTA